MIFRLMVLKPCHKYYLKRVNKRFSCGSPPPSSVKKRMQFIVSIIANKIHIHKTNMGALRSASLLPPFSPIRYCPRKTFIDSSIRFTNNNNKNGNSSKPRIVRGPTPKYQTAVIATQPRKTFEMCECCSFDLILISNKYFYRANR